MLQKIKNREQGFTIIEVLIVLAIAGLIMLIVFLAVPALQRNSRNTQRTNDISSALGAVTEYSNNNSGTLPSSGAFLTQFAQSAPKFGYYTTAVNLTWTLQTTATAPPDPGSLDGFTVVNFAKCDGNAATVNGATTRSIAVVYDVEGSGGALVPQCKES